MKKDFIEFKLSKSINTSVGSELKDLDTLYLKCFNIADHRNATISLRNQYKRMVIDVLPELEKLPAKYLFSPWELSRQELDKYGVKLGYNYPNPMVDLKESRNKALSAFQTIRKQNV